jgi:hypothetical protein
MEVLMKLKQNNLRHQEARREYSTDKNQKKEEKIAHVLGPSYDFWKCEGDSIYDEIYGDEI